MCTDRARCSRPSPLKVGWKNPHTASRNQNKNMDPLARQVVPRRVVNSLPEA